VGIDLAGVGFGPVLDKDTSASVQVIATMLNGELPGIPRFGFSVVDVRDIADLHVRAIQAPQAVGQRYLGSGSFVMMSEIAQILRDKLGSGPAKSLYEDFQTGW
jgi:dihydroflavonol-4-reductase